MPSHETTLLSRQDLQAIIAYCQQVLWLIMYCPPVKSVLWSVMAYLGKMPLLSVETINHKLPMLASADTTEGIAQGKYLSISCSGCHQTTLKGGEPIAPPRSDPYRKHR